MEASLADSDQRARAFPGRAAALVGVAGLVLLLGVVARRLFAGLTTIGIDGVDTFSYLNTAVALLHAGGAVVPDGEAVDRVSAFAVDVIALKVLGASDYAIRAVNAAAQLVAIALVYLLGWRVSRNPLLALAAAALYGLNPWTTAYARSELPHIAATLFVLLALHCALSAISPRIGRRAQASAAAGGGFFAAAAVGAHEDLALLVAGLVLTVAGFLIAEARQDKRPWLTQIAGLAAAFVLGCGVGLAGPMLVTGVEPHRFLADLASFRSGVDANTAIRTGRSFVSFIATVPPRILGELSGNLIGLPLALLTAAAALVAPFCVRPGGDPGLRAAVFLELPAVFYLATFILVARVYLEGDYARILLPLLGPILVFTLAGGAALVAAGLRPASAAAPIATGLGLALAVATLAGNPLSAPAQEPSMHRRLYDAVKAWPSDARRLLLPACYGVYRRWVGVGSPVYLDGRAVPIYGAEDLQPFDQFVVRNHVKYVLVLSDYRYRPMTAPAAPGRIFARLYDAEVPAALLATLEPAASLLRPATWWLSAEARIIFPGDSRVRWSSELCAYESTLLTGLLAERHAVFVSHLATIGDLYALP